MPLQLWRLKTQFRLKTREVQLKISLLIEDFIKFVSVEIEKDVSRNYCIKEKAVQKNIVSWLRIHVIVE